MAAGAAAATLPDTTASSTTSTTAAVAGVADIVAVMAAGAAVLARPTTATGTGAAGAAMASGPGSARELSPPSAWALSARCWVTAATATGIPLTTQATESMITSRPGVRATTRAGDWARWPATGCTADTPIPTTRP